MKAHSRTISVLGLGLIVALGASTARAQSGPDLPQPSPAARVDQRVGVTDFKVEYSSPGVKGRAIWGGLVPYGEPWRTGANSATKLTASRDFNFGGKAVKAGTYALYTIPTAQSWTFILNSSSDNWGTNGYDKKKDVVRVTVKPTATSPRERMTFLFSDTTDDSTNLDLEWEKVRVRVPIKVDTKAVVAKNIEDAVSGAWRPHFASARWLLDTGGDLNKANAYIEKSIAIQPTWWNNWVKAQILAKQGNKDGAVAAATEAQKLGKGDQVFEGFFKDPVAKAIADWKKR